MENPSAEVISQELLASIFEDQPNIKQEVPTPPVDNTLPATPSKPEEIVQTPPAEQPKEEVKVFSDYSKRLKNIINDGLIDNISINYNGEDVDIEDIQDLTEEGYNEILKGWKEAKQKQESEKYLSIEGISETTKKLIEIDKVGGDITEIVRENVTAINQLHQLKENIDDEKVQISIVGQSLQQKGLKPQVIEAQLKALIDDGELETVANGILEEHLNIHSQAIEDKKQFELQRFEKEKQDNKDLRKNLSSIYKELNIPDAIQKVLIDNATKLDKDNISNTDKLYFEASKDPKKLAEINFFLNNPEEFKKWISSKKVLQSKLESNKAMFTVNINSSKKAKLNNSYDDLIENIMNDNK